MLKTMIKQETFIYDCALCLSAHNIASPDMLTIALSVNDFFQETQEIILANSRLGLELMVK